MNMKKNGFTLAEIIIIVVMLVILALIVFPQFKKDLKPESAGGQKGLLYRITVLGDDKIWYPYDPHRVQFYPDRVEFYIEALIRYQDTGYILALSRARAEIESKGYGTKIMPASLKLDDVQAIWVIAERKK